MGGRVMPSATTQPDREANMSARATSPRTEAQGAPAGKVRETALKRLDVLVGTWTLEARFPSDPGKVLPGGQSVFEWMKGGQLLLQRTEVPHSDAPASLTIVACDPNDGSYVQHYFDSRGVIRLYTMTFSGGGLWTLLRNTADFSPLDFSQRFAARISSDQASIRGAWEKSTDGAHWEPDFDLTYRRSA
jgi:hypothetical protein